MLSRSELRSRLSAASWKLGHWTMRHVLTHTPIADQAWRMFDLFQQEGVGGVIRRLGLRFRGERVQREIAPRLRELAEQGLPIVFAPTVEWEITLFQRPQQLALALAAQGALCIYVTKHQGAGPAGIREIAPRCYLADDLPTVLQTLDRFCLVVFSTSPEQVSLASVRAARPRALVVYDYLDEQHSDVYEIDPSMRERHERLLVEADLVTVTADRLLEEVRTVRENGILFCPNAADVPHFRRAAKPPAPSDVRKLAEAGRPIIGYYGALASWFDYELVRQVAKARPGYEFVLIGVDYDRTLERSGIGRLPNVHMLGPKRYVDLPSYLAWFDVSTIPFLLNDVTEATSPIKLFEFMAGGTPIVTTDLRECRKYRSVLIAKSPEEFAAQLDRALSLRSDPDYRALLAREADANSWHGRASDLLREVRTRVAARGWSSEARPSRALG